MIKLIESPRDAMQSLKDHIPAALKADYINSLLKVGFDIIDFGSFVSPEAIPQFSDIVDVIDKIDIESSDTRLMVLTGNTKGGEIASHYDIIDYLAFPTSVSETFLAKNINSNPEKAGETIIELYNICEKRDKELIVYITMGFGNPYGDTWSVDKVTDYVGFLKTIGIKTVSLSDITGVSTEENIKEVYTSLSKAFPEIIFGFHLHTDLKNWFKKVNAAYENGCVIFDSVINGYGGCPMTGYELLGNLPTEKMLEFCRSKNVKPEINMKRFNNAVEIASSIFKG